MASRLRYLLDTNVLSEWVRPAPKAAVVSALERHQRACAIAATTLEELCFGFARLAPGRRRDRLETWLANIAARLPVLAFDARAAWWLGVERARLSLAGVGVPQAEGQIAAIAASHGLKLVTHNRRDFEMFEGVEVEDWHA